VKEKKKKRKRKKRKENKGKINTHFMHQKHLHFHLYPWLAQELSHPISLNHLSQTLTLDFTMHGCNVKLGSCSIISRVSSRSSLQSSHGSLGFLSNVF
jgi:hypothetical protein